MSKRTYHRPTLTRFGCAVEFTQHLWSGAYYDQYGGYRRHYDNTF
jgi:hypothetical protein